MADLSTEKLSYQTKLIALLESITVSGTSGTILPTRLTLINLVKIKLDELIPQGDGVTYTLESSPNVSDPLDLYINGLLDESSLNVSQTAPKHYLLAKPDDTAEGTPNEDDNRIGYVVLPDDYIRLHSFKMAEWKRDVTEPLTPDQVEYSMQDNPHIRGGIGKPVCRLNQLAITEEIEGADVLVSKKVIEYFSVNYTHEIAKFLYIAETAAEDLDDNLYPALTWICAGKILQNLKEFELSTKAFEQAKLCFTNLK